MLDVYPPNPSVVPAGLTDAPPSYRRKAWIAGLALVGFLLAYGTLTGWFTYKAVTLLRDAYRGGAGAFWGFVAGTVAAFLALFLGKALFFVRRHHDRGLIEITKDEQPQLFEFLHRLAADTGAPTPHRVYLSPRVNAAVFYDLRIVNLLIPSRKNLEIGVGLVNTLTLSELKAVLAHEFGHFAQRSMAVGNWVYVGQQIASAIVAKRDVFDKFLRGVSSIDLRVAWIGWGLRIVVWSIRSVLDSMFAAILVAERALSREMELQADLVSVSVTGSDALVHALFKLRAADGAWDHAIDVFADEVRAGKAAPDLCAMHLRVVENTRWMLSNPQWGAIATDPSALETDARARHRVFSPSLAQPPQMWSTHPPSHVREDNAKRHYVDVELDARPAWIAFDDPDAIRSRITAKVAELVKAGDVPTVDSYDLAASLAAVDATFAKLRLDPRYRGSYRGRCITRSCVDPDSLVSPAKADVERERVRAELADLYPQSSGELLERADTLESERNQLDAIRRGVATAAGGVVRHRGNEIHKREIGRIVGEIEKERDLVLAELHVRDCRIRTAHRDAAALLGRGWPEYLAGLRALLHYAEHTEAHVDESGAHLRNVFQIVTADGRVSEAEARRLIASGSDVVYALGQVFGMRDEVHFPFAVGEKLGAATWAAALPDELHLPQPTETNIGEFMDVVDGWFRAFSNALGALRNATLEVLLATEHHIATCVLDGSDPGDAVDVARVPRHYTPFCHNAERPLQLQLDAWDRFMTADGWLPGIARLAVAGGIVAIVVSAGNTVAPTLTIHNGLAREVVVQLGEREVTVAGLTNVPIELEDDSAIEVVTRTTEGEVIEQLSGEIDSSTAEYVYNVGGGSLMIIESGGYGRAAEREPDILGAPRWFEANVDYVFGTPPSTGSDGEIVTMLRAYDDPQLMLGGTLDTAEVARVTEFHVRWEPLVGRGSIWFVIAGAVPDVAAAVDARLAAEPGAVLLERLAQDTSTGEAHAAACARSREAAERAPENPDAAYLATRCIEDPVARDDRFLQLEGQFPQHGWIEHASAVVHAERDDIDAAVGALQRAMRALPMLDFTNAVTLARLLRLSEAARPDELARLAKRSMELEVLVASDPDATPVNKTDEHKAIRYLGTGDIGSARSIARSDKSLRRLIAASDGATSTDLQAIESLDPEDGTGGAALWSALALAQATSKDAAPYIARVRERVAPEDVDRMLAFCDYERLMADLEAADVQLRKLEPELRGHAAVMGIVTLREKAPARWREDARRLLFAAERPWFAVVAVEDRE